MLFKVDAADYMLSICGNDALRELSSPGKSGSFFYLTHDDRYMIKTIKKAEVKVRFWILINQMNVPILYVVEFHGVNLFYLNHYLGYTKDAIGILQPFSLIWAYPTHQVLRITLCEVNWSSTKEGLIKYIIYSIHPFFRCITKEHFDQFVSAWFRYVLSSWETFSAPITSFTDDST